jgi:hypothetical protein
MFDLLIAYNGYACMNESQKNECPIVIRIVGVTTIETYQIDGE